MIENEKRFTDKEAAAILHMSVYTLRNWRGEGRGPKFCRLGRSIRYTTEQLQEFLKKSEVEPTA